MEEQLNNQQKFFILKSLLDVVKKDHPEFEEEGTTGRDLIDNAKLFLRELSDTSFKEQKKDELV
jgi:hypothetical protein